MHRGYVSTNGKTPTRAAPPRPRVLILMARTGGGHVSLAEALRDRLHPAMDVTIADPIAAVVRWHYRVVSRHARWVWSLEYNLTDRPALAMLTHRTNTLLSRSRLNHLLDAVRPDMIISTYPFLTWEVAQIVRERGEQTPLILLFADPESVHQAWLSARQAWAFAPTREVQQQAAQAGFEASRLYLSGWPVRAQFWHAADYSRAAVCAELGLHPEHLTIFVQGGGEGAAGFADTLNSIQAASRDAGRPLQIILAAGTNTALIQRYTGVAGLRVLPFTPEIARYMAAADLVMGKAGPNTLFESVSLGKPFLATTYIPGQEAGNLAFIERYRLGGVALTHAAQYQQVRALLDSPRRLAGLQVTVANYRRWNELHAGRIPALTQEIYQCLPTRLKGVAHPSSSFTDGA